MVNTSWFLTFLADACQKAGQLQAALGHLAEAQRLAEATGGRRFQAETLRLHGDVLLATGDPAAAETCYAEALALAQRQRAKLCELCAAMSLARLWRDQGKRTEALGLLAPVYGWFTEGFGTPVLQEAKALLGQLALIRKGSPNAYFGGAATNSASCSGWCRRSKFPSCSPPGVSPRPS